jgi:long-chain acyl-CoA synthetase
MSFIDRFFDVLANASGKPLVTEVHGARLDATTGRTLAALVGKARAALRALGVAPGDRVVLVANNSTRWVATDLAILGEGAIAVPLYARQAPNELGGMIADCSPRVVIAENPTLADALRPHLGDRPLVLLESLFAGADTVTEPPRARTADDLVTIIYTSGTSGEPKGVTYSVRNVDFMLPVIRDAIEAMLGKRAGEDRVFHYLPLCFAGSRMVLWMTLFRGHGVLLSTNLQNLAEEMKTARPNYYLNVPFLLERVRLGVEKKLTEKPAPIRHLWSRGKAAYERARLGKANLVDRAILSISERLVFRAIRAQIGADLDCLICGSAALPEDTQRWFEMLGIPVYQVYGLTETTAIVTMDRPGQARAGRVGWAIPGVDMRLGEEDELQVRGANIFHDYWQRPEATAETRTADGWFRTGDQAEIDPSGSLKLIGRVKNVLVPLSGHNVAPEPIEEKLLRLPGVEQAVVFGHARPFLVAVLTGDLDHAAIEGPLAAINEGLPFYKRLREVHLTAERLTPENGCLTANQKLKRRAIERHFKAALDALYDKAGPA